MWYVISAYVISFALLGGLLASSLYQYHKAKAATLNITKATKVRKKLI